MNSIKCPHCGLVNWNTAETCKRCQYAFIGPDPNSDQQGWEEQQAYGYQQPDAQAGQWDYGQGGYQQEASQGGYQDPSQGGYQQGGYRGGYQGGGYGYPYGQVKLKSGLAIASMVVGIISLVACGLLGVGPVLGLILGIVALKRANNLPSEYGGKGFAIAGIVLSIVSFFYVAIVLSVAIPNLMAARRMANEAGAIRTLRVLNGAQQTFQATTGRGQYGTLQELAAAHLIDEQLARGVMYQYVFEVKTDGRSYEVLATPKRDGDKSSRSFYSSEIGVIRGAKKGGMAATAFDPPIDVENEFEPRQASRPTRAPQTYSPAY